MSSRFWNFVSTLIAGQTARSEQVVAQLQEVDTAFAAVAAEMNRGIRLTDGVPGEVTYQLEHTAAQRGNKIIGFDASGNLALLNAAFAWRGDWLDSVLYGVNDVVRGPEANNFSLYICKSTHTSTVFVNDLASRWDVMIDLTLVRQSLILHQLVIGPDTIGLIAGQDVMCDVTAGSLNLVLPSNPLITDQPINIMHVAGNLANFPITVQRNGKFIMGLAEDMTINTANASFGLAYANDTLGWRVRGV